MGVSTPITLLVFKPRFFISFPSMINCLIENLGYYLPYRYKTTIFDYCDYSPVKSCIHKRLTVLKPEASSRDLFYYE